MRLNKLEKEMLAFLVKHRNQWHSFNKDKATLRALGALYLYRGLGIRGLEIDRTTMQMRLNMTPNQNFIF